MLTTIAPTTTTTTAVRIKSLDSVVARDEQKDLEVESEELANNEPETEEVSAAEIAVSEMNEEQCTFSGLSTRANEIKSHLREKVSVKAILLKQDGSSEAISYDASSWGTRELLSGRPSIIGEIEDLQVVAVQSLRNYKSSSDAVNRHTLPVPLCHNKGEGDFVLFRVDPDGKASDVTLAEYQKYVDDHKALTATALKNYNNDEEPIRSNTAFDSSSS